MKFRLRSLAFTLPALLLTADAGAARQPEYLDERPLEPAAGPRGRLVRTTSWEAPPAQARLWQGFTDAHGSRWRAVWDTDTGVPLRIFGQGIPAPGASADADTAEAVARRLLAEQLALLAPGASVTDFQLVSNVVHGRKGDLRTVGFVQTHRGLRVLGGQVSFLIKRDRVIVVGSEAAPRVDAAVPFAPMPAADLVGRAQAWIESAYGARPTLLADGGLAILPLVREASDGGARLEHHAVRILTLDLDDPRARWDVYLDAFTGAPVARRQTLAFASGTVRYNTPVRHPRGERQDDLAIGMSATVNGQAQVTSATGQLTWSGGSPATVGLAVSGPLVRVTTGNGSAGVTSTQMIADGATGVWNASSQAALDAQLTGFIHAARINAFATTELNGQLGWLGRQLRVNVNENGNCNAYSTGDDIHFFIASNQCENTGRLPDVIYHEFGHSLHAQSVIPGAGSFDSAMSEGVSDYLAATTVDDPAMGRGFFLGSTNPLRHLDPTGREARWPDDIDDVPHTTGLIIGGALWDLRKELVALLGAEEGKRHADDLYYATLQRAADIPSTYAEVLAADDDDGDLANGTPNKCLIDRAFGPHGLVDPLLGLGIGAPVRDGNDVTLTVSAPAGDCPAPQLTSVVLRWRLRGGNTMTTVPLIRTGDDYQASIPAQPDGSVVQYNVTVTLGNGTEIEYPANVADPLYEYYVGPLVPVYCTDFESDPFAAGWTHGRTAGNDDWEWGAPRDGGSGDPRAAFSGASVIGNDLGMGTRDGLYPASTSNWAESPAIDVTHTTGLRVQYRRWLGVEDGFYDDAEVFVDGARLWNNHDTGDERGSTHHRDREWRFHDLAIDDAYAADGTVKVRFAISSDQGLQFGGWTIDDFCVMARTRILPGCGDGQLAGSEQCDDGNNVAGDGCTESCTIEPGVEEPEPEEPGGCCSTGGSPAAPLALGLASIGLLLRPRRRRQ